MQTGGCVLWQECDFNLREFAVQIFWMAWSIAYKKIILRFCLLKRSLSLPGISSRMPIFIQALGWLKYRHGKSALLAMPVKHLGFADFLMTIGFSLTPLEFTKKAHFKRSFDLFLPVQLRDREGLWKMEQSRPYSRYSLAPIVVKYLEVVSSMSRLYPRSYYRLSRNAFRLNTISILKSIKPSVHGFEVFLWETQSVGDSPRFFLQRWPCDKYVSAPHLPKPV